MTWIVGKTSLFGHAYLVSDIRVAFADASDNKSYKDCLQKIHPIGRFVLGGFSGSVRLGFELLECLRKEFGRAGPDRAWNVDIISNTWWPRLARRIFSRASPIEQRHGSQIMLAWAHPTDNVDMGDLHWPQTDVCIFSSPEFEQEKTKSSEALSIGSGSRILEYKNAVQEACDSDTFYTIMQGANPREPHIQVGFLAGSIERVIKDNSQGGISPFIQIGIVNRGQSFVYNYEYSVIPRQGVKTPLRFPPLSRSYPQFVENCRKWGYSAEGAICCRWAGL